MSERPGTSPRETAEAVDDRRSERAGQEPGEMIVGFTPRQVVGGFALLAALLLLLFRRRRRRDDDSAGGA